MLRLIRQTDQASQVFVVEVVVMEVVMMEVVMMIWWRWWRWCGVDRMTA